MVANNILRFVFFSSFLLSVRFLCFACLWVISLRKMNKKKKNKNNNDSGANPNRLKFFHQPPILKKKKQITTKTRSNNSYETKIVPFFWNSTVYAVHERKFPNKCFFFVGSRWMINTHQIRLIYTKTII